jgi:hypothetical protein
LTKEKENAIMIIVKRKRGKHYERFSLRSKWSNL